MEKAREARKVCKNRIRKPIFQKSKKRANTQKVLKTIAKSMQKRGSKKERLADPIFIKFWWILEPFWGQISSKIASGTRPEKTLIFKTDFC